MADNQLTAVTEQDFEDFQALMFELTPSQIRKVIADLAHQKSISQSMFDQLQAALDQVKNLAPEIESMTSYIEDTFVPLGVDGAVAEDASQATFGRSCPLGCCLLPLSGAS